MKKKFRIKVVVLSILGIIAGTIIVLALYGTANGVVGFGGPIIFVDTCSCSGGLRITVGPPVGGSFLWQPGLTQTFAFGQLRSGVMSLGTYIPGGICLKEATPCIPLPVSGIMTTIGTSF